MVSRNTVWLLCLLVAVGTTSGLEPAVINAFHPEDTVNGLRTEKSEWSMMESFQKYADVAGNRLVVDRTTVEAKSPDWAQLRQAEARVMADPILRHMMDLLQTIQASRVANMPVPLLPAAHMDSEPNLKEECDEQLAEPLSTETAVDAAVRAISNSCDSQKQAAVVFIKDHLGQVLATEGWAHAVRTQPEEVIQLSRLLAEHFAATSTPATTQPTTTTTTTTSSTTTTSQAADDVVTCPTTPLDEDKVGAYRILLDEEKNQKLMEAAKEGQVEELRTLLAAGAFPNARDLYRRTVLQWAAWRAQAEAASCLLAAGAGVDTTDDEGYQPLHMAAIGGNPAVVRLLAAWGADPDARDNWGWTPLHLTVREDTQEAALALLEAGASDEVKDYTGRTPLALAKTQQYRNPAMESLLAEIHRTSPLV